MKQITLLPKDFNSFDTTSEAFMLQFGNADDCPITRALQRVTKKPLRSVISFIYNIETKKTLDCNHHGVAKLRSLAKRVERDGKATCNLGCDISNL